MEPGVFFGNPQLEGPITFFYSSELYQRKLIYPAIQEVGICLDIPNDFYASKSLDIGTYYLHTEKSLPTLVKWGTGQL